jgi:hypothetical protein
MGPVKALYQQVINVLNLVKKGNNLNQRSLHITARIYVTREYRMTVMMCSYMCQVQALV